MNLREMILHENSKLNWQTTARFIGSDKSKMHELMQWFFSKEKRIAQLSAQIIALVYDENPDMVRPYLTQMVQYLSENPIDAVKRIIIRTFQFEDVPEESEGIFFDHAIGYLKDADESIAVKAFSMTAIRKICDKYPELSVEAIPFIEILVEEKVSPGIVHRGKQELEKLYKIHKNGSGKTIS